MMEDGLAIVLSAVKTKNSITSGHLYITKHKRQGKKQRKRREAGLQRRPESRQGAYEADGQMVDGGGRAGADEQELQVRC